MRAKLDAANDKLGPGNATVEALSQSIKDRKEKVKKLSSEGAKIFTVAGLIGFLLGLGCGCLVVVVSKAISMSRA